MITKENRAITLVALIITIIILLILAGISINFIFGNEGIFSKTQYAVEQYKNAQEKEEIAMEKYENIINSYRTNTNESVKITGIGKTEEEQQAKLALDNSYDFSTQIMTRNVNSNKYIRYNDTNNTYIVQESGWYHLYCRANSRTFSTTATININNLPICKSDGWCPANTAGYYIQYMVMYMVKDDIITLSYATENTPATCQFQIRALF